MFPAPISDYHKREWDVRARIPSRVRGVLTSSAGRSEAIMSKYISTSEFDCPTAVIKVNRLYRPGLTAEELSDITRGFWRTAHKKVRKCDIVLYVYQGEVLEVYAVDEWVDGETLRLETNIQNCRRPDSYGFNGHVAPKAVRDRFLGRSVEKLFKHGDQNPVRAFNVG